MLRNKNSLEERLREKMSKDRKDIEMKPEDAGTQYELGNRYRYGDGVKENHSKAFEWYKKAAEQGYIPAQSELGDCYHYGDGVERDDCKAVEWYKKAAVHGDISA